MSIVAAGRNNNPFPGLRPFLESEQHLFFGRESQIDAMVDKLAANRFLAVVGTSGSGKSSLVNCGLRPALRTGLMAKAGTAWRMAQCRPGGDPLTALSVALAEDGVLFSNYQDAGMPLKEIIDTTLRMSKLGLVDMVEQAQLPEGSNLLLVIDQFEELFRYRHLGETGEDKGADIGQQAAAFVSLLMTAIEQSGLGIYIVITMRSDFLGDCAQFPGLTEAINSGQYLVPRMTREQRRAAITGPIGVGGAKIYPPLLTRLVNEVGTNPDQLSILQHALNRTWSYWENDRNSEGMLDIECYDSIGSMASALDLHAKKAFAELDTERKQKIGESLFKALTDKASDARGVRRPTQLGTLCKLCDATPAEVVPVIDVFRKPSRSFLMPPADVEIHSDTVIDISHESLMRIWQKLDQWADEEADAARMYRRLAETSILNKQDKAGLLRDPDLRVALQWRDRNSPNATWARRYNPEFDGAMSFLKQSEKSDLMWKRLRLGSIAASVFVLFGGLAYASYYFNNQKVLQAEAQRAEAEEEKIQIENELILAEEELKEVVELKKDALDQVEVSNQKVAKIEENLTRIFDEESEQVEQSTDKPTTSSTSQVANEQIQFFDAISSLDEVSRKEVVELVAQLEADQSEVHQTYTDTLAQYQKLKVQKKVQCELVSLNNNYERELDNLLVRYCDQVLSEDFLSTDLRPNQIVARDNCSQDIIAVSTLAKLGELEQTVVVGKVEPLVCNIEATAAKIAELNNLGTLLEKEIDHLKSTVSIKAETIQTPSPANASVDATGSDVLATNPQTDSVLTDPASIELAGALASEETQPVRVEDAPKQHNITSVATTLDDSRNDGFVVCKNVVKLEPQQCSTEFDPGRVYAFARIVTGSETESVTLSWFKEGNELPRMRRVLEIKHNPNGYRTYSWNTFDSGSYAVSLTDKNGDELREISFNIK